MAETSFSQPSIDKQALSSQNTAPMRLQIRGGGNYCRKPFYPLDVGSPSPAGGGHRKHTSDARLPCRIASNRGCSLARSERGDLVRLVREPARDRAAEDRDDADQQHRDERDE